MQIFIYLFIYLFMGYFFDKSFWMILDFLKIIIIFSLV